ncbi:MAG: hypothetical protein ACRCX2_00345 [Paraclostridium sp.]
MKNIFIVGNLIWISIENNSTYSSNKSMYMLCGRRGRLVLNAIMSGEELTEKYPDGVWRKAINVSDTIIFEDK